MYKKIPELKSDHLSRFLLGIAVLGIIAFILIASLAPFKKTLFSRLFGKPSSYAASSATTVLNTPLNLTTTFNSIGIELFYSGDSGTGNTQSQVSLKFKKHSDTNWRNGLSLWQVNSVNDSLSTAFYGSAVDLDAGTSYDIQLTITDPEGVIPPNSLTASNTNTTVTDLTSNTQVTQNDSNTVTMTVNNIFTRVDNIPSASSLTPNYYIRSNGSDSNPGTSPTSAWATLYKAMTTAPSGAIVQVGPGAYQSANCVNKDFTRTSSITFVAQYPAVDDSQNIINDGNRSVVDCGVYTSPTGSGDTNAGVWQQVTLTGSPTGQTRTLWHWISPFSSSYPAQFMGYTSSRSGIPTRIPFWDRKSGTTTDTSGQVWAMTPVEDWADLLYTNKSYNYGFTSFGSDVYLRMPNNFNPNDYYITLVPSSGNATRSFAFAAPNARLSGFELHYIGASLYNGAENATIDHNIFIGSGAGPRSENADDATIEYNIFKDSNLWSEDPTQNPGTTVPWTWVKGGIILQDGTNAGNWQRVGAVQENAASGGPGKREVFRYNKVDGLFNGFSDYNAGLDRYASQDTDIYQNTISHIPDDAFEPEDQGINIRIWDNNAQQTGTGLSTGPLPYGPVYLFRNQFFKTGGSGDGVDGNGNRGIGPVGFKYSGSLTVTKALVYVINNTFWTDDSGVSGGDQFAGGGSNTEHFYLRNNLFRMTKYGFSAPANTTGTSDRWNEDYNFFFTSDPTRNMNYASTNKSSVSSYQQASGQGAHTNTLAEDPTQNFHSSPDTYFNSPTTGNLSLLPTSPFVDSGTPVPNIADLAGINYFGAAPDLGAIETQCNTNCSTPTPISTPVPTTTPTPTVVPTATPTPTSTPGPTATPSPTGSASMSLSLVTPPPNMGPACIFSLNVNINTAGNLTDGADALINFDPTKIQITSITNGTFFSSYPTSTFDNSLGKVTISGLTNAGIPVSGSGTLATLNMQFKVNASSGGTNVTFNFTPGSTTDSNLSQSGTGLDILGGVNNFNTTVSNLSCIQGDTNHDGIVNLTDLSVLLSHFNQNYPQADLNSDGIINSLDFSLEITDLKSSGAI